MRYVNAIEKNKNENTLKAIQICQKLTNNRFCCKI